MFLVLNMVCSRIFSLKENILSKKDEIINYLDVISVKIYSYREIILSIVSKNAILKLVCAGSFLIAYLHLLKNFFLLPYIIPDYNLIVNIDLKIYIDILILSIYALIDERLYLSRLDRLQNILAGEITTIIGMYLSI